MNHHQETIDAIRTFTTSSQPVRSERMTRCANDFAQTCRETNDRLRQCVDALRRGMRSDAIAIADAEPNLLDLIAQLDIPEREKWLELCSLYDLPEPEPLQMESAAALNEAYSEEQPLESLMAHHRLMALARAPLRERLSVMRDIAAKDAGGAFWEDDIRAFERVRFDEIRAQTKIAVAASDSPTLLRLKQETGASQWRESVPRNLRGAIDDACARLAATESLVDLQLLAPRLDEAYAAMSLDDCKSLLRQWASIIERGKMAVPPDLQDRIEPISAWVAEQDQRIEQKAQFDQACTALQQAIDTDQPTPALDRAYAAAIAFQFEMPESLESRFRQRLASRKAAIRHRRQLIFAGIAAATLLIAGGITALVYQKIQRTQIADAHNTLLQAAAEVRQGNLEKGQSLAKRLSDAHSPALKDAAIIRDVADLDSAVESEKQRRADFQTHFAAIQAAGVEKPSEEELKQAAAFAKLPAESAALAQFNERIVQYRQSHQQDLDHQFCVDGIALSDEADKLLTPSVFATDPDAFSKSLDSITQKLLLLRSRPSISDGLKGAQLAALEASLKQHRDELARQQAAANAMDRVRKFGSTAADHEKALKEFVAAFPKDPRVSDFNAALNQSPQSQAVEAWSTLIHRWSSDILPSTYDSAKTRLTEVKGYLEHYPSTPLAEPIKNYQTYLEKGLEIASPTGPWQTSFKKLITNPLVHDLFYLATSNGRYYVNGGVKVIETMLDQSFDAVTTPDTTQVSKIRLPLQSLKSTTPAASPQSDFAHKANERLDAFAFADWTTFGTGVLEDLMSEKDIDPVLRGILLENILQTQESAAAWTGEDEYARAIASLHDIGVDDLEWIDPRRPVNDDIRRRIEAVFIKVPLGAASRKALTQRCEKLARDVNLSIEHEAILLHAANGYELIGAPPAAGQNAWLVSTDGKLFQIGHTEKNQWVIDAERARLVPEGSLVFVIKGS